MNKKTKLLFVVTEDWYFLSHRLPMARAALAAGFEVHVACSISNDPNILNRLHKEQIHIHHVSFERGKLSPIAIISAVKSLFFLYISLRPSIIHHVAVTPCVYGGAAALLSQIFVKPTGVVQAITGLGSLFLGNSLKAKLMQVLVKSLFKAIGGRENTWHLVQNEDDAEFLKSLSLPHERIVTVPGSGIDSVKFTPAAPPATPPIIITFVGRMLHDKGIMPLVAAFQQLLQRGVQAKLVLAGTIDPANMASLTQIELDFVANHPNIEWRGHVKDVVTLWQNSHIAVLPSKREGFPKSLLEAAACGLPLVATDVPGCRALVQHEINGLLVPLGDVNALANALETLCENEALRAQYGKAARDAVENGLDDKSIGNAVVGLYQNILAQ